MARLFRAGVLIVALVTVAACSPKGPKPKSVTLNGFERVPDAALLKRQFDPGEAIKKPTYPNHDFDVATSGYATLASINKEAARAAKDKPLYKFIQGKTAAKVRFTVPSDYKTKGDNFPRTWESGFALATDSKTPLAVTDWSPYKYFSFRLFNPGPLTQTVQLRFTDSASSVTRTSVLAPIGEVEVEVPLDLLSEARLNPKDIRNVTLYLDSAGQDKDPVLLFDEVALHDMDAALRAKLASEEGEAEEEDEDWDSEDEEGVRKVDVIRPGQALAAPAAVTAPAAAE